MNNTLEMFSKLELILDATVGKDRDVLLRMHKDKLEILDGNAFWHIAVNGLGLPVATFTISTKSLRAVLTAMRHIDVKPNWSIGVNRLEFQTPKTTFQIPSAKSTMYDDVAEIYLKPLLVNTYKADVDSVKLKEAVNAVAPFGEIVTVSWTETHLKLSANTGQYFSGEVNIRVDSHNFPESWVGHFKAKNLLKWTEVSELCELEFAILKAAANKTNSPSPLVIEDIDSTLSLVLSPLVDLPIF